MPMSPRLLRPIASRLTLPTDADARTYVLAVNSADGQPLEKPVVEAIDAFVLGCKSDGIWDAIKASCILAGARTLSGALTPLKGAAPQNNNFTDTDYNRETGLVGDGSTTYLDSNRAGNADGQDDCSLWAYVTENPAGSLNSIFGNTLSNANAGQVLLQSSSTGFTHRLKTSPSTLTAATGVDCLVGISRVAASEYTFRCDGTNNTISVASDGNISDNIRVFSRIGVQYGNHRLAIYGIGSAIDLATLEVRVSALITAIGAAI